MDDQAVKSGSAQHNRQNGHKHHHDDAQSHRNLPTASECGFARKPPGDVGRQQTGNGKEYEKKPNHINPCGFYLSVILFSVVSRTAHTLIIKLKTPIDTGVF
jgi:hypothetical protein